MKWDGLGITPRTIEGLVVVPSKFYSYVLARRVDPGICKRLLSKYGDTC